MSTERRRSLTLCLLLLSSIMATAFVPTVAADSRILLDLSEDHITLAQGESANVTLTIENNDSSIRDFDLSVDASTTSPAWNVTLADQTLSTVLPTFSVPTTVIVRLSEGAVLADGGSVSIIVSQAGTNISSAITLHLSVAPSYLPHIEHTAVGDGGLLVMEPGDSLDITVPITNQGSSLDHIVLAVEETADLAAFWANHSSGTNESESNNTGGNGTGGNGTNGTGNTTVGPTELILNLSSVGTNLTATLDSLNLTANASYLVDWLLEENGSIFPHDTGLYNWTSDGSNHSWNKTWNLTVGEWCFSASINANLSTLDSVASCTNVTASGGNGSGNGTSMGRAVPSGWEVRWLESTLENMSAGESRAATLRVTIPNGESPGDYGFLLSAGSALGNFTISETVVIRVNGTHHLTMSSLDGGVNWLPNATNPVSFLVVNAGSSEAESIYNLGSVMGGCTATLDAEEADGDRLAAATNESIIVNVSIDSDTDEGNSCDITLEAWEDIGETAYTHTFSLTVGADHGLSLVSGDNLTLTPGESVNGMTTVRNQGTEATSIRLHADSDEAITLTTSSDYVWVEAGETADLSWSASVDADSALVGNHSIAFSVEADDASATLNFSWTLTIEPWASIRMEGPLGGAFDVGSEESATVEFTLTNNGTGPADASLDWSDAPAGFTITPSADSIITGGDESTMTLTVAIDDSVPSGTYAFSVLANDPGDGSTWDSVSISAHVSQRAEVRILLASDAMPVSSRAEATYTATVINDGNEPDTFSLSLFGASGFDVSIDPQHLSLNASESGEILVTLRRMGAPGDVTMMLTGTSESDEGVSYSVNLTATLPNVEVKATLATNVEEISAGGTISLTLFLENLGEAEDTLLITGPSGFGCDHPAQITLDAGAAASNHAVSCVAMTELLAGTHWVNFTATSLSDASEASTASTSVLIMPSRNADDNPLLTVTISGDDWSLGWNTSATFSVTVENGGNEQVSGFLLLAGESAHDLSPEWNLIENGQPVSAFSVGPGASSTYSLKLRPNGEPTAGTLDLRIEASGSLSDGHGFAVSSETVQLTVEFEQAEPTEAVLWEGGPLVNAANLAIGMFSGWLFAALLLLWMRRGAKLAEKERIDSAWDEAAEEASKDDDLSAGEIRAAEDGTARCHACEARIMLPSDKEPPFRFKCPTCEEMNRVVGPREED
jgi:uncharacterized membrane protein